MEENTQQPTEEFVPQEQLQPLRDLQAKMAAAQKDVQIYDLAFRAAFLELFVEYGLTKNDSFDINTGIITRAQMAGESK